MEGDGVLETPSRLVGYYMASTQVGFSIGASILASGIGFCFAILAFLFYSGTSVAQSGRR